MAIDRNLVQGSMSMMILRLLETKDMYGYEMIEALRERSNNVFELKAGTLYPLLHSLESRGDVVSYEDNTSGKTRKYYQLTPAGKKHAEEKKKESILEAKEEVIRLKNELDREIRDRRAGRQLPDQNLAGDHRPQCDCRVSFP